MKKFMATSLLLLVLAGCSKDSVFQGMADDDSRDAKIEEAALALDDQDYDKAISALAGLYDTTNPDPEVSRLLGSAYMGKAGIDVTGFMAFEPETEADDFNIVASSLFLAPSPWIPNDSGTESLTCNIEDLTVLMTSSGGQFIDGHCIDGMISYLKKAKRVFYLLHDTSRNTQDDTIQYGILSAVHFAVLLGNDTADALNSTLGTPNAKPGSVPVPINKKAYNLYRTQPLWSTNYAARWNIISTNNHAFYSTPLTQYQDDLTNMHNAVEAFGPVALGQNDVKDDLESLLRDILRYPAGDDIAGSIQAMTTAGITGYIEEVLSVE